MEGCVIEDSILMGADYYQQPGEGNGGSSKDKQPGLGIGRGAKIRKAIIDKNARIGEDVELLNKGGVVEAAPDKLGPGVYVR